MTWRAAEKLGLCVSPQSLAVKGRQIYLYVDLPVLSTVAPPSPSFKIYLLAEVLKPAVAFY
jgi:hypothetical protein